MELRSLKFAVTLAEELHFGRAAERHFVSAQPFGRTIAALEREIGTPLFNRTTRRVELTPAGDKFVSRAEQVLLDVEELVTTVRSAADVESRRIADRHPGCHRADQCPGTRDQHTGPRRRTRLMALSGAGGLTTAKIVGETANITRFRSEACFAMHAGVAPPGSPVTPSGRDGLDAAPASWALPRRAPRTHRPARRQRHDESQHGGLLGYRPHSDSTRAIRHSRML